MVFSSGKRGTTNKGWHDIMGTIAARGTGPTDPKWTQMGTSEIYQYKFTLNDEIWIDYHIPHDYVPGSAGYIHCHWTSDGTDVNPVVWKAHAVWARGYEQQEFNVHAPVERLIRATPSGRAWTHYVSESDSVTIPGMEPDMIVMVHFTRIANGGTDNTDDIFLIEADLHYQSTSTATPYRTPDFYHTGES